MVALPAPPPRTTRVDIIPGEVWTDVIIVPAGPIQAANDAMKRVQKRPPCLQDVEVEYDGLCWIPHVTRPPKCAPGLMPGSGYCLIRVPAPKPPNTSVGP